MWHSLTTTPSPAMGNAATAHSLRDKSGHLETQRLHCHHHERRARGRGCVKTTCNNIVAGTCQARWEQGTSSLPGGHRLLQVSGEPLSELDKKTINASRPWWLGGGLCVENMLPTSSGDRKNHPQHLTRVLYRQLPQPR